MGSGPAKRSTAIVYRDSDDNEHKKKVLDDLKSRMDAATKQVRDLKTEIEKAEDSYGKL